MAPIHWTPERVAALVQMRAAHASFDAIAERLGIGRNAIIKHWRALGHAPATRPVANPAPALNTRLPLPSGHAASWGAIVEGTVLAGEPYPFPIFL